MAPPLKSLLTAIQGGRYDHSLDRVGEHVVNAIRERSHIIDQDRAAEFSEGDRVKIKGPLRPKYFVGKRGTVTQVDGRIVWVKLDHPIKRGSRVVGTGGIPARLLEDL
jgi:ribosomal protein L21E